LRNVPCVKCGHRGLRRNTDYDKEKEKVKE